jgi:hypothetical protein
LWMRIDPPHWLQSVSLHLGQRTKFSACGGRA